MTRQRSFKRLVRARMEKTGESHTAARAGRARRRRAARPKSARFDWPDGRSRLHATFEDRGGGKSRVTIQHARVADADAAARMKAFWRERLSVLADAL